MKQFDVICTEGALTGFFEDFLSYMGNPNIDTDNLSVFLNWHRLLFKEAYLILDMNDEQYEKQVKTNPMYLLLEKSCQSGGSKVSLSPDILNDYQKCASFGEFVSPLYIIGEGSKELKSLYGRLFLSRSEMNSSGQLLFNDSKFIIMKEGTKNKTLTSWNALGSASLPLSDVILIDNYIIKQEGISNITDMLRGLIPKDQEESKIRITIITSLFDETQERIEEKTDNWFLELKQSFKDRFKNFTFDISIGIISLKNLNHDRAVLTNYVWIDSGQGFNCFNKKGPKVTTTIKYMPIFTPLGNNNSSSAFECWNTMRYHARKLIKSCAYKKGNFNNNLLLKE